MRRLIYVSNNVLLKDQSLNPFFAQEVDSLLAQFGAFSVISPQGSFVCREGSVVSDFIPFSLRSAFKALLMGCFNRRLFRVFVHLFRNRKGSPRNILGLIRFSARGYRLASMIEQEVVRGNPADVLIYSYWLSYDAYACAMVKEKYPQAYALSRAHSYEIQIHRNACNPYLMKDYIFRTLDRIAFISQDAMRSVEAYYPIDKTKMRVLYIGSTEDNTGFVKRKDLPTFTVVSCSTINANKQLDWMISVLEHWDNSNIHWIHVGDGSDRKKIERMAQDKLYGNPKVSYTFKGQMSNKDVRALLRDEGINVFVNMSKSEGVPVTLMEAMSEGLPVIAPKICGIPELVDESCGILFDPTPGSEALKTALVQFHSLQWSERNAMGICAYERWKKDFCLERNIMELFKNASN